MTHNTIHSGLTRHTIHTTIHRRDSMDYRHSLPMHRYPGLWCWTDGCWHSVDYHLKFYNVLRLTMLLKKHDWCHIGIPTSPTKNYIAESNQAFSIDKKIRDAIILQLLHVSSLLHRFLMNIWIITERERFKTRRVYVFHHIFCDKRFISIYKIWNGYPQYH